MLFLERLRVKVRTIEMYVFIVNSILALALLLSVSLLANIRGHRNIGRLVRYLGSDDENPNRSRCSLNSCRI